MPKTPGIWHQLHLSSLGGELRGRPPEVATDGLLSAKPRLSTAPMRGAWLFTGEDWCGGDRGDRIELRQVRHLIQHQQQSIDLPGASGIALRWSARTGGTFGPASSRAENTRQRHGRSAPPSPQLDRGQAVAWHVVFVCGRCGRNCRILYNPLVSWRSLGWCWGWGTMCAQHKCMG